MGKITRNAFCCKKCGMVVESKTRHDFQECKCGNFTDGGLDYIRRGGKIEDMEDLSEPHMYFNSKPAKFNKADLLPKDVCLTNVNSEFQMSDELADKFSEEVNDFLSEHWGFCTRSWGYKIVIEDIDWDTEEEE